MHEARKDHDKNLKLLLERCSRKGIRLNSTKIRLRLPEVAFMGHLLTKAQKLTQPNWKPCLRCPHPTASTKSLDF